MTGSDLGSNTTKIAQLLAEYDAGTIGRDRLSLKLDRTTELPVVMQPVSTSLPKLP